MMIRIVILFILSFNVFSGEREAHESKFIYDIEQDTKFFHHKINLDKMKAKKKKEKKADELKAREYNNKNFMAIRMGVQREEFEEKQGFFVESMSPSLDLIFYKKMFDSFYWNFDFQGSKNNFIGRQMLGYSLNYGNFSLLPFIRLGEKVALTEQVDSGYFFFNTGGQIKYSNDKLNLLGEVYTSANEFSTMGFYTEFSYKFRYNAIGLYFSIDHYNPNTIEYDRQGQQNSRVGVILKF